MYGMCTRYARCGDVCGISGLWVFVGCMWCVSRVCVAYMCAVSDVMCVLLCMLCACCV